MFALLPQPIAGLKPTLRPVDSAPTCSTGSTCSVCGFRRFENAGLILPRWRITLCGTLLNGWGRRSRPFPDPHWTGWRLTLGRNVRELKNVIERAVVLSEGPLLRSDYVVL